MPRKIKRPHLWLKPAERGRAAVWCIKDGARRTSTGCTEHDCEAAERALADYIAGKYRPPTGLGAKLLVDEVMAGYVTANAEARSRAFILATAAPIAEWWSGRTIAEVNKANCAAYVKWRTAQHRRRHPNSKAKPVKISSQTARHDLKTLRAALNHYKAAHDAMMVVPTVTVPAKKAPRINYCLSRDDVAHRLRLARKHPQTKHLARVILIGIYSGTRSGAILALRWLPSPTAGWIDVDGGIIHRAGAGETETNKRKPPVRINARLLPHLRRWRARDMAHGITHAVHYMGEPIQKLRRSWASVGGGKDGVHVLRHTAVTWLMRDGVPLYEAAGYLGMTPETLWTVYGHHHPDFQKSAASATGRKRKA